MSIAAAWSAEFLQHLVCWYFAMQLYFTIFWLFLQIFSPRISLPSWCTACFTCNGRLSSLYSLLPKQSAPQNHESQRMPSICSFCFSSYIFCWIPSIVIADQHLVISHSLSLSSCFTKAFDCTSLCFVSVFLAPVHADTTDHIIVPQNISIQTTYRENV